jgi:hypothetical protein
MLTRKTISPERLPASTPDTTLSGLISAEDLQSLTEIYAFIRRTGRALLISLDDARAAVSNGYAHGAPAYGWSWDQDVDVEGNGPTLTNAWESFVSQIGRVPDRNAS